MAALAGRAGWDRCFLVLRKDRYHEGRVQGNLLLSNVFGAHVSLVDVETYAKRGQRQLTAELAERVVAQGLCKKPFVIPVGGSVTRGVWGEPLDCRQRCMTLLCRLEVICCVSCVANLCKGTFA